MEPFISFSPRLTTPLNINFYLVFGNKLFGFYDGKFIGFCIQNLNTSEAICDIQCEFHFTFFYHFYHIHNKLKLFYEI